MHSVSRRLSSPAAALTCFLLLSLSPGLAMAGSHNTNTFEFSSPGPVRLSLLDEARLAELESRQKDADARRDYIAEAEITDSIGVLHYAAGQFDEALDAFTNALTQYCRLGDERGEARELSELGATYAQKGMDRQAMESYQRSLPLWRKLDQARLAAVLGRIAEIFRTLGDVDSAVRFNQQALSVFITLGDRAGQATVLNNMGLSYFLTGNKKKGTEYFNRACAAYLDAGDTSGEATAFNNLGVAYSGLGNESKALSAFDKALALQRQSGNRAEQAAILEKMGVLYHVMGQSKTAQVYYDSALSIYREVGDHQGERKTSEELTLLDSNGHRGTSKTKKGRHTELAESGFTLTQ